MRWALHGQSRQHRQPPHPPPHPPATHPLPGLEGYGRSRRAALPAEQSQLHLCEQISQSRHGCCSRSDSLPNPTHTHTRPTSQPQPTCLTVGLMLATSSMYATECAAEGGQASEGLGGWVTTPPPPPPLLLLVLLLLLLLLLLLGPSTEARSRSKARARARRIGWLNGWLAGRTMDWLGACVQA